MWRWGFAAFLLSLCIFSANGFPSHYLFEDFNSFTSRVSHTNFSCVSVPNKLFFPKEISPAEEICLVAFNHTDYHFCGGVCLPSFVYCPPNCPTGKVLCNLQLDYSLYSPVCASQLSECPAPRCNSSFPFYCWTGQCLKSGNDCPPPTCYTGANVLCTTKPLTCADSFSNCPNICLNTSR